MALYPKAIQKPIPPGPNDPRITPRLAILHVAATEATSLYDWFNGPSGGVESHFYVRRDGTVEQYRDTGWQADANVMANDFAVSIETQGLNAGEWTPAQLAAIKALLVWLHDTHHIPLSVPKAWNGSGVGYHVLFEDQWDQRHASCPGPARIKQFNDELVPWMVTDRNEDDMSAADVTEIKSYLRDLLIDGYEVAGVPYPGIAKVDIETQRRVTVQTARLDALTAAVKALAEAKGADADAITAAVVAKIDALDFTLSAKDPA